MGATIAGAQFYVRQRRTAARAWPSRYWTAGRPPCAWKRADGTTDQAAAWGFTGDLFGWDKDGEMDMGPRENIQFIRHGDGCESAMRGDEHSRTPHGPSISASPTSTRPSPRSGRAACKVLNGPHGNPWRRFLDACRDRRARSSGWSAPNPVRNVTDHLPTGRASAIGRRTARGSQDRRQQQMDGRSASH